MSDSSKINHWCVVCGSGYHACDSCDNAKTFTPWRRLTDTIEHFKIFNILKDYNNKIITKDEAKEMLADIDLTGRENFKESSKRLLEEIFQSEDIQEENQEENNLSAKADDVETEIEL